MMKYMIKSMLSGNEFMIKSPKQKKLFMQELSTYNYTLEMYCDEFFENKATNRHKRELKEDEMYFYNDIMLSKGTYKKVIVNLKFKCEVCNKFFATNFSGFLSHIMRIHKYKSIEEYLIDLGFANVFTQPKTCGFCHREAKYTIDYNIKNRTYKKIYKRFLCDSEECRNDVCIKFFGKPYSEAIKEYEHIGGKTEYLMVIYNTDEVGLIKIGKSKVPKTPNNLCCDINGFIEKYGINEGTKRYKSRCENIAKGGVLSGFIEKHGKEKGEKLYLKKLESIAKNLRTKTLKNNTGEANLYLKIKEIYQDTRLEYPTLYGTVDIYIPSKNIIIEYYGDYWHINPELYNKNYFHKQLKMSMKEKHEFDTLRMNNITKHLNTRKLIIVWEKSFNINNDMVIEQIKTYIENNTEGTLWI